MTDRLVITIVPAPGWSVAFTYGTLPNPFTGGGALMTSATQFWSLPSFYGGMAPLGANYLAPMEQGFGGTTTWYGDNGSPNGFQTSTFLVRTMF